LNTSDIRCAVTVEQCGVDGSWTIRRDGKIIAVKLTNAAAWREAERHEGRKTFRRFGPRVEWMQIKKG
jgi:hypothetical protein